MAYLRFLINAHDLTVTWPLEKRLELQQQILLLLGRPCHEATPKEVASIIGKIRSAALIAPWGNYLSFTSQEALTAALRKADRHPRWFWRNGKMRVPAEAIRDLHVIADALLRPESDPTWTRPIALLIPRTPTESFLSDASYGGLGGWSPKFQVMWRVMRDDLLFLGFPMREIDLAGEHADPTLEQGLHINPLEFIAIIINIWLALKLISTCPYLATGYIINLLSDHTSAITWIQVAGFRLQAKPEILAHAVSLVSPLLCSFQPVI